MSRRHLAGILIAGLILTATVSVIGNFVAFDLLYRAFDKYNDSRLDPIGEHAYKLLPVARGRHAVVILGDSHARNWNYPGPDVLNLGIPSQTSAQVRLRSDLYRDALGGKRLILLAGGNDLKSLSTNMARRAEIVEQCLASLEAVLLVHKERFDETVIATIPPAFRLPLLYRVLLRRGIVEAHLEINAGIRDLARKHGVRLLDAYALLEPRMRLESLSEDGIHMNAAAYRLLQDDLGGVPAAGPGKAKPPLLSILADADHPKFAEAAAAWKELSPADRHAFALEALGSEDPALSLAGAVVIDPSRLDLRGLHRLDEVMLRDPLARFLPPPGLSEFQDSTPAFGSRSLPSIWEAIARRGLDMGEEPIDYSPFHRTLRQNEVPALAPLLARLPPKWFRKLLEHLSIQSANVPDARHESLFIEIFRYALRRIEAEEAGEPVPEWGSLEPLPGRAGLPAAFLELWEKGVCGWLASWATRLSPSQDDLSFLMNEILWAKELGIEWWTIRKLEAWAARAVVRLASADNDPVLKELLDIGGEPASLAAAEAAVAGRRSAWENLKDKWPPASWLAQPAEAERSVLEALKRGKWIKELDPFERLSLAFDAGIEVPATSLDRIVAALREGGFPPRIELRFFAEVVPGRFTRADAERIVARWKGADPGSTRTVEEPGVSPSPEDEEDPNLNFPHRQHVALLEVHAPDLLVDLLRHLAREPGGEERDKWSRVLAQQQRGLALEALARLGDAELLEEMLELYQQGWFSFPDVLGHVKDDRVKVFLLNRISAGDPEDEPAALRALAVYHGCPAEISRIIDPDSWCDFEKVEKREWAEARALVMAGDHVGAVLMIASSPGFMSSSTLFHFAHEYGPALDGRILDWISSRRTKSHEFYDNDYWLGTAALALAGDRAAALEWSGFLDAGRTYLIDKMYGTALLTLDGDPELVRFWIERLGENCCVRFYAHEAIKAAFPTFPHEYVGVDGGRLRAGAERWFAEHAGTFVKSRLLGGWVPGPR